jgi:hypothetical protein
MRRFPTLLVIGAFTLVSLVLPAAHAGDTGTPASAEAGATEIVAYYFHGNFRCATCKKLEAYSKEAITQGFEDELADGRLVWRVVNTDEAENKHFVKDFELVTKSLVLVEYRDGEVVRFENLKLVWQLLGSKEGFLKYVRDATRDFLASPASDPA